MTSPREQLEEYFTVLIRDAQKASDNQRPDRLSLDRLIEKLSSISGRYMLITIAACFLQAFFFISLVVYAYPDHPEQAYLTGLAGILVTLFTAWFMLMQLKPVAKKNAINRRAREQDEWKRSLANNTDYLVASQDILSRCCAIIAMNNYFTLKEIVLDRSMEARPYFIVTRKEINDVLYASQDEFSYPEAVLATINTVRSRIIDDPENKWLDKHYGVTNFLTRSEFFALNDILEDISTIMIHGFYDILYTYNREFNKSNREQKGVVSLIDFKARSKGLSLSPSEENYVELTRIFGLLADVVDPLIDRCRLMSADSEDDSTQALMVQSEAALDRLMPDLRAVIESATSQARMKRSALE